MKNIVWAISRRIGLNRKFCSNIGQQLIVRKEGRKGEEAEEKIKNLLVKQKLWWRKEIVKPRGKNTHFFLHCFLLGDVWEFLQERRPSLCGERGRETRQTYCNVIDLLHRIFPLPCLSCCQDGFFDALKSGWGSMTRKNK